MTEETIVIAIDVLKELFVYECDKTHQNDQQIDAISSVLHQLTAIHRIWFGG